MDQFESIIAQIAQTLSITSLDVYVFFGLFVIIGIITLMGIATIYNIFFGTVLGIGIFVLFTTLLSPEFQTPETLSLVSETFAQVLIGSSVYLIFILTVLVPLNGGMNVTLPRNHIAKIAQTLALGIILVLFLTAIFLGLIEKSYIFVHTNSAFTLLKKLTFFGELQGTIFFSFITSHLPTIVILSISFVIYKILFSDIVNTMVASIIANIKKRHNTGASEDHGGHDDHGEQEEFEEHAMYDEHGGHGHH